MYKVLIVDDEKMIRMGIKKVIPWHELGVGQVFTAGSAREALEYLKEYRPQIMITDIRMSEMSGLELIEAAKEIAPALRVLVLTGYDSFEYARQSLRLKVQDFFLKPVEESDLSRAIREQVHFLEEAEAEAKNSLLAQRTRGVADQARLENCMRNLVHRRGESKKQLSDLREFYSLERFSGFQVMLIAPALSLDNQPTEKNFREMSMKNICISIVDVEAEGITFLDDDGAIAVVYFLRDKEDSVLEKTRKLSDILQDEFDCKPKMVIGSVAERMEGVYVSYHDARHLLDTEKEGIQDIVQLLGEQKKNHIFQDIYVELKEIMCSSIGNTEYVLKAFRTFAKASESYNLSRQTVRRLCFELASCIYFSYAGESGESDSGKLDALSKSLCSASREEACSVTEMFLVQMLGGQDENVHEIIAKAKYYISEHLTEDLTVSNIAVSLYITPNYFSRLFKRVTKEGCNEYIVRKRIEKAKSLLDTTSLKIGEIALMVGYRDTNYFSLAFKKHTGKSPTKYREEIFAHTENNKKKKEF